MPVVRISEETKRLYDKIIGLMNRRSTEALGSTVPPSKYTYDAVIKVSLERYLEVLKHE